VIRAAALVAAVFGAATIFSGGRVLFGDGAAGAGDYLPYIVWFNFLAGFAYIAAGIGLWLRQPWAAGMSIALALLTALFLRGPQTVGELRISSERLHRFGADVGEQEASNVPEFRDEVSSRRERLLEIVRIQHHVRAHPEPRYHRVPERIGSKKGAHVERVDSVAERL